MPKFLNDFENFDPNDCHSVNISVYKPDGFLSFWNWFTRKNKDDCQRKNIKFKINKEDLEKMKLTGFDFQKLQNLDLKNKTKLNRQCNMISIKKSELDEFLVKGVHPGMKTKTFVKRLVSKSTISVKSKESCGNLKFVRTMKSQKSITNSISSSKGSFKFKTKSNTNCNVHSVTQPRNVFLKSVPTTVLQSNTKKLDILEKMKTPRGNRTTKSNLPENLNNYQFAKDNSNVIPMLLTRMKSMEEHLSDIETTTKQINEAVSKKSIETKLDFRNDSNHPEQNSQKQLKCAAGHKIYSKHVHVPRKNKKKNQSKKLSVRGKVNNYSTEAPFKPKPPNAGFAFNYFSDSSYDVKNPFKRENDAKPNKPGLFNNHSFTIPENVTTVNTNVGCDLIMNVVKVLAAAKGSTNLPALQSTLQDTNNVSSGFGLISLGNNGTVSKSSFDWKHASVSKLAEGNHLDIKVNEHRPILNPFAKKITNQIPTDQNQIVNEISNPNLHEKIDNLGLLNNSNTMKLGYVQRIEDGKAFDTEDILEESKSQFLEVGGVGDKHTEEKTLNVECHKKPSNLSTHDLDINNRSSNNNLNFKESIKNNLEGKRSNFFDENLENRIMFKQENTILTDAVESSENVPCTKKRTLNMITAEENESKIIIDPGAICSVSIKNSAVSTLAPSPERLLKRTTIACSSVKKDPKVSITILVQDSMKDEVQMRSNMTNGLAIPEDDDVGQVFKKKSFPTVNSFGPKGDYELLTTQPNMYKAGSASSLGNLSSVSSTVSDKVLKVPFPQKTVGEISYSKTNKNFYTEVKEVKRTNTKENLNLGSPGTYLNREKRKVLDEKVLCPKEKKCLLDTEYDSKPVSPTRSCSNMSNTVTSFDHLIETSIIHQETSYSKTKFNICKENTYNSRTPLKPLQNSNRCSFAEESLNTENNYDISTKYTSKQCFMFCRNNNVANFRRSKFPQFQEKPSETCNHENKSQPFLVIKSPEKYSDKQLSDVNKKGFEERQKYLALCEYPILEESEDESVIENPTFDDQQMDKKVDDEAQINSSRLNPEQQTKRTVNDIHVPKLETKTNIHDETGLIESNSGIISVNEDVKPLVQCQSNSAGETEEGGLLDFEDKTEVTMSKDMKKTRDTATLTSCNALSAVSSTSVQTDWSLVGISVDHFNCSKNKPEPIDCEQRTVAIQTDIKMEQISLVSRDSEETHNCCKSFIKNCQFSELVACNGNLLEGGSFQEIQNNLAQTGQAVFVSDYKDLKEMKIAGVLVAVMKDTDQMDHTKITISNGNELGENLVEQMGIQPSLGPQKSPSPREVTLASENNKLRSEENLGIMMEGIPHRCTIPCLTSISDETMMSSMSESSGRNLMSSHDYLSVPQVQAINRGIFSYYNTPQKPPVSDRLAAITESRPSTSESKDAFFRVLRDFDSDDEELKESEIQAQFISLANKTSRDPLKESNERDGPNILEKARLDGLDETEDNTNDSIEEQSLQVLESIRKTEILKPQVKKAKNITMSKQKETRNVAHKSTNYSSNYLSIDRRDGDKKGNCVFTQT